MIELIWRLLHATAAAMWINLGYQTFFAVDSGVLRVAVVFSFLVTAGDQVIRAAGLRMKLVEYNHD